jgi:hypothetical protein
VEWRTLDAHNAKMVKEAIHFMADRAKEEAALEELQSRSKLVLLIHETTKEALTLTRGL